MIHAMGTLQKLDLTEKDIEKLRQLSVSRSESFQQVTRARILLGYH